MKIINFFVLAIAVIVEVASAKCHKSLRQSVEFIDVMVAFTERARNFIAKQACGVNDVKALPTENIHIKRYIQQRIDETNKALRKACVPYELRVVKTIAKAWSTDEFDETTKYRLGGMGVYRVFQDDLTSIITYGMMDEYGADLKVLFYHHSIDWKGGMHNTSPSGGVIIVPLQFKVEHCGLADPVVNGEDYFILAHEVGHFLGADDEEESQGGCSKVHADWRTIMSDPLNTTPDFCKPRRLEYSEACAEIMADQEVPCVPNIREGWVCADKRHTQVGDCKTIMKENPSTWFKDGVCSRYHVKVQNLSNEDIFLDLNSAMCDFDGGDCCKKTCRGKECGDWQYECLDPHEWKNDICKPAHG